MSKEQISLTEEEKNLVIVGLSRIQAEVSKVQKSAEALVPNAAKASADFVKRLEELKSKFL